MEVDVYLQLVPSTRWSESKNETGGQSDVDLIEISNTNDLEWKSSQGEEV